jgi:hypothetical protein
MISQHRLGLGLRAPLDGNGHADVEVPAGDYTFQHVEQGRPPYHTDVTIPPEGTSVPVDLPPKSQVASLKLNATPAITGLLDPGTEIRFTVEARNAAGQVIPINQLPCTLSYQAFNPVGSQVADIVGPQDDPITGLGTGLSTLLGDLVH